MKKTKTVVLWILVVLLAASFVPTGIGKFTDPGWSQQFAAWGYPAWFRPVVGIVEIAAAVLLLVPRIATPAAGTLVVVMTGALLTHLVHGNHPEFPAAQMASF